MPSDVSNMNLNINGDLASLNIKIWKASGFDSLTVYALKITVCRPGMNIFTRPKQY